MRLPINSGLINVVSAERAAKIIISNMQRKEVVVFIPGIYYYIQVRTYINMRIQLIAIAVGI